MARVAEADDAGAGEGALPLVEEGRAHESVAQPPGDEHGTARQRLPAGPERVVPIAGGQQFAGQHPGGVAVAGLRERAEVLRVHPLREKGSVAEGPRQEEPGGEVGALIEDATRPAPHDAGATRVRALIPKPPQPRVHEDQRAHVVRALHGVGQADRPAEIVHEQRGALETQVRDESA